MVKIIPESFEIIREEDPLKRIELSGRTCFHPDTEILTDCGWIKVCNINDEKILTYSMKDRTLQYEPANMVHQSYHGNLITSSHPNMNFKVTTDHRMVATKAYDGNRNYSFMPADKLKNSYPTTGYRLPKWFPDTKREVPNCSREISFKMVVTSGWRGEETHHFHTHVTDSFITILGAFITEGSLRHPKKSGSGIVITQSQASPLYSNVITALDVLKWTYHINSDPRKPYIKHITIGGGKPIMEWFKVNCGSSSRTKHLPPFFREFSNRQLKLLLKTLYEGDGSGNTTRHEKYLSISKLLLDQVQEIFILLGKNATVGWHDEKSQYCYTEESHRDSWKLKPRHIESEPYIGQVYCPSTNSGVVCIRNQGKSMWCGNCYKSEGNQAEGSARKFVKMIIGRGHESVLEHAAIALMVSDDVYEHILRLEHREFLNLTDGDVGPIISANVHAWRDMFRTDKYRNDPYLWSILNHLRYKFPIFFEDLPKGDGGWPSDVTNINSLAKVVWEHMSIPERIYHEYMTIRIICNRGVTHEWVRSRRQSSYSQESTRYCNYSANKYGSEITYIDYEEYLASPEEDLKDIEEVHELCEEKYNRLIGRGNKPQIARNVLPIDLKTEMIITYPLFQWQYLLKLRTTKFVHPQFREISIPLLKAAKKEKPGIFDDIIPE